MSFRVGAAEPGIQNSLDSGPALRTDRNDGLAWIKTFARWYYIHIAQVLVANIVQAHRILVGVVGAPHGLKGEVRIKSFTSRPADIGCYRPIFTETGRDLDGLSGVRLIKDDMVVARFEGVTTREGAAALTNARLFVERASLPAAAEEEFYHADLIGLQARTIGGLELGRVAAVLNFGAGDMLEVEAAGRDNLLIPFTKAFVPVVDLAAMSLTVDHDALTAETSGPEDKGA